MTTIRTVDVQQVSLIHYLFDIHKTSHAAPWLFDTFRDMAVAPYTLYVIEDERDVLGYAIVLEIADEATLMDIAVSVDHRNRGVGNQLLKYLITNMSKTKLSALLLEVRASNAPALHLYNKCGFNVIATRKGYYPAVNSHQSREDAMIMQLKFEEHY